MRLGLLHPDLGGTTAESRASARLVTALGRHHEVLVLDATWDGAPAVDLLLTTTTTDLAIAVRRAPSGVRIVHHVDTGSTTPTPDLARLEALAPLADAVVAPTSAIAAWLLTRLGPSAPRTVHLPSPAPGIGARASLDSRLFVATALPDDDQQHLRLVAAFARVAGRMPQWRLRIHATGPQRNAIDQQARKLRVADRVETSGGTEPTWAEASVAVVTARSVGSPADCLEAMAAGVPAVGFDAPSGLRDVVDHGVNGLLVTPGSIPGLATALLSLADGDLRHRMGDAGRATALAHEADTVAAQWTTMLGDVAVGAPGQAGRPAQAATGGGERTPAMVRSEALGHLVDTVRRVTDTWIVAPAHDRAAATVVASMADRTAILTALAERGSPAHLCLRDPGGGGWPERRGRVADLARDLLHGRAASVVLEPWPDVEGRPTPLSTGCGVELEFWETAPNGDLVAPGPNAWASRVTTASVATAAEATVDDVPVRSLPWLLATPASACAFPVDVVYTWVDGDDPAWDSARESRLADLDRSAHRPGATGRARFVDRGELRYSMRSLHLFAPWVRRIHLVTAGQRPAWLDVDHPMINLVDHRDLLPPEALPTFSSHAIETALHHIDGLSEHFLYLNDDFLLGRPTRPERFFSPGGLTAVFASPVPIEADDGIDVPVYLRAAQNNRRLLHEAFGAAPLTTISHAPYAHRVSVLAEVEARFPEALARTARSPFRDASDVSTLSSLGQFYGLLRGTAYEADADVRFVDLSAADVEDRLAVAAQREQDFLCLGDHHDHALSPDRVAAVLDHFLASYLPLAAPWETS